MLGDVGMGGWWEMDFGWGKGSLFQDGILWRGFHKLLEKSPILA